MLFNRPYEDRDQKKSFVGGVKYVVSDYDPMFYYVHECPISKDKENDLFTIHEVQMQSYRE
jgi:hypothetical protein